MPASKRTSCPRLVQTWPRSTAYSSKLHRSNRRLIFHISTERKNPHGLKNSRWCNWYKKAQQNSNDQAASDIRDHVQCLNHLSVAKTKKHGLWLETVRLGHTTSFIKWLLKPIVPGNGNCVFEFTGISLTRQNQKPCP